MLAYVTGFRRGVPTVNFDQRPTIPGSLIFQLTDELTPSCITDGLSQTVIFEHALDSETLDANHLVFVDDASRDLVLVVTSAIIDAGMDSGDFQACLLPVLGTFHLFRKLPLGFCQLLLVFSEIVRIANRLTAGERHHRLNAKIDANHLGDDWQSFNVVLYQNGDEVAICAVLRNGDTGRSGSFGQGPVPVDVQRPIQFCQRQHGSIPLEGIGGVGGGLSVLFSLECRVFGTPFKEIDKGAIQVAKRLLKRNRRDICQPGILLLEGGKPSGKVIVGELFALLFVSRRTSSKPQL